MKNEVLLCFKNINLKLELLLNSGIFFIREIFFSKHKNYEEYKIF